MLVVLLNLSGAWKTLRFLDEPRPPDRPLWYVGGTFLHNRRFGLLLVGGLAAEVVVRLALGR
jgi:hypothetical protein